MLKLYDAFQSIYSEQEFDRFMDDLLTPQELRFLNYRWKIAQMMYYKKIPQRIIAEKNKFGLATISRVAKCLNENPNSGYKIVLKRGDVPYATNKRAKPMKRRPTR